MVVKVAVVVPAYNVEQFISQTLDSLLAQSFADWECIVIDDGSVDRTCEVVEGFEDPRICLFRQSNAGPAAARNAGYHHSRAPYVMFLDSDDFIHPTSLERLHLALERNPDAILAFGTTLRLLDSGDVEPNQKPLAAHRYATGDVLKSVLFQRGVFWNGGQMLIRRSVIECAGAYDPSLPFNEDWEFFCRIAAEGPCHYIGAPDEVLRHRVRPNSFAPTRGSDLANFVLARDAVFRNKKIQARVGEAELNKMRVKIEGLQTFSVARQKFIQRDFATARMLMLKSLWLAPSIRNTAMFFLAQASQILGKPLSGRLRFRSAKEVSLGQVGRQEGAS